MQLIRTVAGRSLLKRPGRTIFSILGIALGIAVVVGVFTLDHNTLLGLKSPGDPDWQADVRVSPKQNLDDPKAELSKMPGVDGVSAFFQNEVELLGIGEESSLRLRLFGLEVDSVATSNFYRVEEGEDLQSEAENSALIGRAIADNLGIKIGETIELARPRRGARKVCVDGVMTELAEPKRLPERKRAFVVRGFLAPEKLGRRSGGDVVLLSYAAAHDLFEDVSGSVDFVLEKNPKVDMERLTASLGRTFSYELNKDIVIGQAADERAFRNGVRFAGLLALGLGLYVIFHVLSIALVERSREIATLSALGATRKQVASIFIAEASILSLGGGVLGLVGGIGLARILLYLRITTLGAGRLIQVFEIPWGTIIPLALIGCGIALLGSIYPLLRMRRNDVAQAIRGERSLEQGGPGLGFRAFAVLLLAVVLPLLFLQVAPLVGEDQEALKVVLYLGIAIFSLLIGLPLLVPGLLGRVAAVLVRLLAQGFPLGAVVTAREFARRPLRLAVGAAVLAMVAAAFTTMKGITENLRDEINIWADEALDEKLFIAGLQDADLDVVVRTLQELPGYLAHEKGDIRAYVPFLLTGLNAEASESREIFSDPSVENEFFRGRGIVVSTRLARDQNYQIGSSIAIRTGRGEVEGFKVLAISDRVGFFPYPDERIYGLVAEATMHRDFCVDLTKTDRLAAIFAPGADLAALSELLAAKLKKNLALKREPRLSSGSKVEFDAIHDIDRDFILFDVIILLTAALGGLGVLNGQLLSALERSKELGVLKALGATKMQMAGLVLVEAVAIGLIGGVMGAVLGSLLLPLVIEALQIVSAFNLPNSAAGIYAFYAVGGSVLVSLLSALYPIWRVIAISSSQALRA